MQRSDKKGYFTSMFLWWRHKQN